MKPGPPWGQPGPGLTQDPPGLKPYPYGGQDGPGQGDPGDGPVTGGGDGEQGLCSDSDVQRNLTRAADALTATTSWTLPDGSVPTVMGRFLGVQDRRVHPFQHEYNRLSVGTRAEDTTESMGRWSGRDPWTRAREHVPGVVERVGDTSSENVGVYALLHPLLEGFSAVAFRPQLWIRGLPNWEHNPQVPNDMTQRDERVRPQSLVMRAWGRQSTGEAEWSYTERPNTSRARGGTVDGGVVFAAPRFEAEDLFGLGDLDVTDTTATETTLAHVLLAPGVRMSYGRPMLTGDAMVDADAVVTYRDEATKAWVVAGAAGGTELVRATESTGVVELGQGGTGAVRVPYGTTAQRPASSAVGMVRANTSGATPVLEFYNGSNWVSVHDSATYVPPAPVYGDAIPTTDSTFDLGSATKAWANVYADTVQSGDITAGFFAPMNLSASQVTLSPNGVATFRASTTAWHPVTTASFDLGTTFLKWRTVYADTVNAAGFVGGSFAGTTGVFSGTVTCATPTLATHAATVGYLLTTSLLQVQNLADLTDVDAAVANLGIERADIAAGSMSLAGANSFINGTNGWGSAVSGSPTFYTSNPRYTSSEQGLECAPMLKIDGQATASGTQALVAYMFQRVYLATGRAFRFCMRANNTSGTLAVRAGLWADDNNPTASGRPSGGVWIEWDTSVSTSLYLCVSDGSTVTAVACSTLTITDLTGSDTQVVWVVFESTASVKLYKDEAGTQTLEATATTNVPSDTTSRACRPFLQLEKDPSNTVRPDFAIESPCWTVDTATAGMVSP